MKHSRGQLVLLAAVTIAVVLLPLLTAVLQLGYHPDGPARTVDPHPVQSTTGVLERAVTVAGDGLPTTYAWADRSAAANAVRTSLRPTFDALNRSMTASGTVNEVSLNASLARDWAARACPSGPGREFGPCRTDGGIVLQNRAGRSHLVAVSVDIVSVASDAEWRLRRVIRVR